MTIFFEIGSYAAKVRDETQETTPLGVNVAYLRNTYQRAIESNHSIEKETPTHSTLRAEIFQAYFILEQDSHRPALMSKLQAIDDIEDLNYLLDMMRENKNLSQETLVTLLSVYIKRIGTFTTYENALPETLREFDVDIVLSEENAPQLHNAIAELQDRQVKIEARKAAIRRKEQQWQDDYAERHKDIASRKGLRQGNQPANKTSRVFHKRPTEAPPRSADMSLADQLMKELKYFTFAITQYDEISNNHNHKSHCEVFRSLYCTVITLAQKMEDFPRKVLQRAMINAIAKLDITIRYRALLCITETKHCDVDVLTMLAQTLKLDRYAMIEMCFRVVADKMRELMHAEPDTQIWPVVAELKLRFAEYQKDAPDVAETIWQQNIGIWQMLGSESA